MSFNWDLQNIDDHKAKCWVKVEDGYQLAPVTETLIWASLGTGIGTITEKNWREVYARIVFLEGLYGTFLRNADGEPRPITPQDIIEHLGLWTNVGSDEAVTKWWKRHQRGIADPRQKRDAA